MDDNVMKRYTTKSEDPMHYVQYDQVSGHLYITSSQRGRKGVQKMAIFGDFQGITAR